MSQQVDGRIIKKIHQYVGEGIRSVDEMEIVIKLYVKTELFTKENIAPPERIRFFPLTRDIRNHIYSATNKLIANVKDWLGKSAHESIRMEKRVTKRPLFFRSHGKERIETEEGEELLFYNEHGDRIPSEEKVNQLQNVDVHFPFNAKAL